MTTRRKGAQPRAVDPVLEGIDASLLDIIDHVLTKGVVVTGDLVLGVADIDLVYLRLSAVLCAADRILGPEYAPKKRRHATLPGRAPVVARKIGAKKP